MLLHHVRPDRGVGHKRDGEYRLLRLRNFLLGRQYEKTARDRFHRRDYRRENYRGSARIPPGLGMPPVSVLVC